MRARHLVLTLIAAACSGDDTHGRPTTPSAAAPVEPAAPEGGDPTDDPAAGEPAAPAVAPLTEDMARSYFETGRAAEGAARFALEDWRAARDHFAAALAEVDAKADPAAHARLSLMVALADAELGAWKQAAAGFATAREGLPLLADWIGYQEARARYFAHDGDGALERARAVAADSIVGADAELLVGDLLRGRKDAKATADHYRDYLTRRPDGIRRSEARYRLAEALEQSGGDAAEIDALYRAIAVEDPLSSWATKAKARLDARGKALGDLTAAEHLVHGMVLFDAMRNPESEAAFDAALAAPDVTVEQRCEAAYYRAQSRFKARDRKGAAPMFDEAIEACKAAGNTDLEIKAAYQAGRSYAFHRHHTTAIERYRHAQGVDPSHSYTDDALLREAEEWADLGKDKEVRAALAKLPEKFPQGDMRAEAMWRLGWRAWRDGDVDEAIGWWKKQIEVMPIDDNYPGKGQAQYWLGRAYAKKQDADEAARWWEETVRTYPVTYYALLALNRLREAAPKRFAALVKEISTDPAGFDPDAPSFQFQARAEYATPGFARAIELLRLGLGAPAEAELRRLGLVYPPDKKRVDDPDTIEKLWAMSFLYDRAGRYAISHWPTRWHILDYERQWPVGANRARWEVAFPRAYVDLLTRHAEKNDVPFAMQIAIVREESAFDPLRESYANAIGLTQMIFVTAERFAKGTGIPVTRENLRDPEKNVTIGSRFLGFLFDKWDRYTLLVPPSYNAGEGGVTKMLRVRGTWDADEFIEGIIDDQARNYSKRVLGSFFAYTWLYEGTVPEIPNTIPKHLLPKPKK